MVHVIGLYGIEVLPLKKLKELPYDLAEDFELPGEIIPGMGKLTVSGGRRALIEDHRGILEYSDTRIVAALGHGKLIISGAGLKLKAMNRGELFINGKIQSVEWG